MKDLIRIATKLKRIGLTKEANDLLSFASNEEGIIPTGAKVYILWSSDVANDRYIIGIFSSAEEATAAAEIEKDTYSFNPPEVEEMDISTIETRRHKD